jgi:hypothetical protein
MRYSVGARMGGFMNVTFYMWGGKDSPCSAKSVMSGDFPVLTIVHCHTWYKTTEPKVVTKSFQKPVSCYFCNFIDSVMALCGISHNCPTSHHKYINRLPSRVRMELQFKPDSPWVRLSKTCMKLTSAECTVENSWWWAEGMPETCRVL